MKSREEVTREDLSEIIIANDQNVPEDLSDNKIMTLHSNTINRISLHLERNEGSVNIVCLKTKNYVSLDLNHPDGLLLVTRMARQWKFAQLAISGMLATYSIGFPLGEPPYVITDLLPCGSLDLYTQDETKWLKSWDFTNLLIISHRIFALLSKLHSRRIMHRNIKTSNIFLDHNFIPFIGDLECIRQERDFLTNPGTVYWTAPEIVIATIKTQRGMLIEQSDQFETGATSKGDVYSAGLVLMHLFGGKDIDDTVSWSVSSLSNLTQRERYRAQLVETLEVANVSEFAFEQAAAAESSIKFNFIEEITKNVRQWIKKCIKERPEDRATAEEICMEIEKCMNGLMSVQGRLKDIKVLSREKWRDYRTHIFRERDAPVRCGTVENIEAAAATGSLFGMCIYYSYCLQTGTEMREDVVQMLESRLQNALASPPHFLEEFVCYVAGCDKPGHATITALCKNLAHSYTRQ